PLRRRAYWRTPNELRAQMRNIRRHDACSRVLRTVQPIVGRNKEMSMQSPSPLVAFSHLRWDPAFKRPPQVMSRLAEHRPVLYVEEPVANGDEPTLETTAIGRNLIVARPHLAAAKARAGFGHGNQDLLAALVRAELEQLGWRDHAAWLYTPMALGVSKRLRPRATVYEAIANLAALPGAPADIAHPEH